MDCFASDASTLVGDAAPPLKHAAADVEYVKPEPAWDPKEAMRLHMRRKRDADKAEKIKNRSFIVDRVLAINRTREPDRSHSRSPARPYPHVSICRSFVKTGSCPYGAACSFEHPAPPTPPRAPTPKVQAPPPPPPPPPPAPVQQQQQQQEQPKTVYLPVPAVPPMFYSTYRRGSNGELIDPALLPAPVQAQKSLYYRTKPCRYWAQDGACPKGDKCTFIHDPSLAPPAEPAAPAPMPTPLPQRRPSAAYAKPPREPHPAWRVVGGGVTLANARAQAGGNDTGADSEEEAAVECLTGLSASQQSQQSQSQSYAPQPAYAPPQSSQPAYAAQPAQAYATSPPPQPQQAYAAPLPSPVLFDPASPYAVPAPPGQPVFAYAYPAPAYMWSPPPLPPGAQPEGFVYYVAAAPHALELGVPRVPAAVHALQDAGLDTSGLDGSGRPLDPSEAAQPLTFDVDGGEWHGEEDEELEVSQGGVLMDVEEEEGAFPWGAVEKLSWADDVEMEEAELRRAHALDDGRRTSPTTPRGPTARLYELFAAAESP